MLEASHHLYKAVHQKVVKLGVISNKLPILIKLVHHTMLHCRMTAVLNYKSTDIEHSRHTQKYSISSSSLNV